MQEPTDSPLDSADASVSETEVENLILEMRGAQNYPKALIAGLLAGLVSAIIWAGVALVTDYQIGWLAIGVGALVGFAVRVAGKGIEPRFGILGAVIAGGAVFLGQVLMVYGYAAREAEAGYFEVLGQVPLGLVIEAVKDSANGIDLLFYGIAIWEGFKLSFQQLDEGAMRSAARRTRSGEGA